MAICRKMQFLAIVVYVALSNSPLYGQDIVVTGDVRGHYLSSEGDERRLGLVRLFPEDLSTSTLKIDAGNLLFGHHLLDTPLNNILQAPELVGFDLIHLTWMDLVVPADVLQAALRGRDYISISANLRVSSNDSFLTERFAIVEAGGQSVGITGLSVLSDELMALEEMARVAAEVEVMDSSIALAEVLAEMAEHVDTVVVLLAGETDRFQAIADLFSEQVDYFVVGYTGGLMNDPLPSGMLNARGSFGNRALQLSLREATTLAGGSRSPRGIRGGNVLREPRTRIPARRADNSRAMRRSAGQTSSDFLVAGETENPRLSAAISELGIPRAPMTVIESDALIDLPSSIPLGRELPIVAGARSRGHAVSVRRVKRTTEFQGSRAPAGKEFVVISVIAENRRPHDLITRDSGQRALSFGHLNEVMVLIHDQENVIPLHSSQEDFEGALPLSFILPMPRSRRHGDLVYLIPEGEPEMLELRHYHIEYEPLHIPLLAANVSLNPLERADVERQSNAFFEFAVAETAFRTHDEIPAGLQRVELELLGRSTLIRENPAVHFRRGADPDEFVETGRVSYFRHAPEHIFLVSEDGFAYPANWDLSTLDEEPYFLPDLETGGRLVFDIPETLERFRFSIYFPSLGTATGRRSEVHLPMHFDVAQIGFSYSVAEPVIDFGLQQLRVVATDIERSGEGIVVEIEIFNETENPGFWPMERRVGLAAAGERGVVYPSRMTDPHGVDLPWRAHLPPGEPRRMRLHFPLVGGEGSGQLSVSGLSGQPSASIAWDQSAVWVSAP